MAYASSLGGIVMFGGANDPNIPFNDNWLYDGADWQQLPMNININPRLQAAIAYDPNRAEFVLFGGAANIAYNPQLGDTWALRGVTTSPLDWKQVAATPNPSPRVFSVMDYDSPLGGGGRPDRSSGGHGGARREPWDQTEPRQLPDAARCPRHGFRSDSWPGRAVRWSRLERPSGRHVGMGRRQLGADTDNHCAAQSILVIVRLRHAAGQDRAVRGRPPPPQRPRRLQPHRTPCH